VIGTPIDLTRIIRINKPTVRVRYSLQELSKPDLSEILRTFPAKTQGPVFIEEEVM